MELKMITDLKSSIPEKIDWNFFELKQELTAKLDYYNHLVVTENSIKSAKEDKAKLNNLSKSINDERIKREREYMKPFDIFKAEVKEIVGMITNSSAKIDTQIKAFDEIEKSNKLDQLTKFYQECVGDLLELIPFEKVLNPKWVNKGYSISSIQAEITTSVFKIRDDLSIIADLKSDYEIQMKDIYFKSLDLSAAMREKARLDELVALELKRKELAQQKAESFRVQKSYDFTSVSQEAVPHECPNEQPEQQKEPEAQEKLKTIKVIFHNTTTVFRADMKALTEKHNIKYGGIQ